MITLQVTIDVDERALSPARVTEELVKGFVNLREHYFRVSDEQLHIEIDQLTVRQRKGRIERVTVREATKDPNQEYIDANPEPQNPEPESEE